MTEIKIVKIEKTSKPIFKGNTMRGPGFIQEVVYTLEDDRKITSHIDNPRKKKLDDTFQRHERSIAAGSMSANFNDNGEFWGTIEKFSMGAGGMVPDSGE